MGKRALITGIGGQDGFFLAKLLLEKGYEVFGINNTPLNVLFQTDVEVYSRITLVIGDISDQQLLKNVLSRTLPNEVYHFAAQSNVAKSYSEVTETYNANILGSMLLFSLCQQIVPEAKIYNAGSSEMFGDSEASPQNELTPFRPRSPYGVSKVASHYAALHQRKTFNQFVVTGITYNHESERRPIEFVTQKICRGILSIAQGSESVLQLGNLDSIRDWGFAGDYVEAMWRMLQMETPHDLVIATGIGHSIEQFVTLAASCVGVDLSWTGSGVTRRGIWKGRAVVAVSSEFYRPSETVPLIGDSSLIQKMTEWKPQMTLEKLIERMLTVRDSSNK